MPPLEFAITAYQTHVDALRGSRRTGRAHTEAHTRRREPGGARYRRNYRHRYFCAYRPRGRAIRRPRRCLLLYPGCRWLRLCRLVLRGVCLDDSRRRLCLHIRVRNSRRNFRMDYRLGFVPGICLWRSHRLFRMERVRAESRAGFWPAPAAGTGRRSGIDFCAFQRPLGVTRARRGQAQSTRHRSGHAAAAPRNVQPDRIPASCW